jgi:hypothetical protein
MSNKNLKQNLGLSPRSHPTEEKGRGEERHGFVLGILSLKIFPG